MKEYVEREAILEIIRDKWYYTGGQAFQALLDLPVADAAPVIHGEWVEWWDDNYLSYCHKCSECGGYPLTKEETMHDEVLSAYCPHCGTRMDGGK